MKKVTLLIFSLLIAIILISCKDNKEYKITIFDNDGNVYKEMSSNNISLPAMPEIVGYEFKGFDKELPNKIDNDIELHPVYEKLSYNVVFKDIDGKNFYEEKVYYGEIQ